ncbi:VOC family protein [Haloprofundus halobius]|uniref:VOC family protein n=1 Tax=Haloprofundus halobius TaxID=2876194 RepID=UPI001CCFD6E8|nr:VOC family protein [Haloprofundus halobius]
MPHLGHVHLKVRELDRAVDFYSSLLGLDVTERHVNYAFLSFGSHHHDLALQALGDDAADPGPGVGLYHSAWEVETPAELRATYETLDERGVSVAPVDHGISKALYFDDPDGNGVEVYLDTREANDQDEWDGRNRRFDPAALSRRR